MRMTITPYAINSDVDKLIESLENDSSMLIKWFSHNDLVMNDDKSHLLVPNYHDNVSLVVDKEIIEGGKVVKLLGITIDNTFNFTEHVSKICKKVNMKHHALARISKHQQELRRLLTALDSQFSYCPLIWMFHSRTLNNRINKSHETALRLVYKDSEYTFEQLLEKDDSLTIHHRNIQKLAIEIYKVIHNE